MDGVEESSYLLYSEEENSFDLPSQPGDQLTVGTSWECRWQGLGSLEEDTPGGLWSPSFPRPQTSEKVLSPGLSSTKWRPRDMEAETMGETWPPSKVGEWVVVGWPHTSRRGHQLIEPRR